MRGCKGLHCGGCRHGASTGLGIGSLLVLLGVLVYAAHHRAIDHAASTTGRVLADVLALTAITLTAAAVAAGTVWAVRARHQARRRVPAPLTVRVVRPCAAPDRAELAAGGERTVLRVLPGWQPGTLPPADQTAIPWARTRREQGQ